MTLWAFLSDVHGRGDRLARVLADIEAQRAQRIFALGDIASTSALTTLDRAGAVCTFGNWEASGLRGLAPPYRSWVARWPAVLQYDGVWASHASPVWPAGLGIGGVVEYLRARGLHWTHLFPSMQHSEASRAAAFAALEAAGTAVFFHGHTHTQEAWRLRPGEAPLRIEAAACPDGELILEAGDRWLVGVGSVGDPHDGAGACYALFDTKARRVVWRRV
jgi:predicted phosphodiesterase